MLNTAHPVIMPADGLRPQAESAMALAAAPGIERQIRVLEIADEVIFDLEVALIDIGYKRQVVHIGKDLAFLVVDDHAILVAVGNAVDGGEIHALGNILDGKVKFIARDEINRCALQQAFFRLHRDLGANHADFDVRVGILDRLGDLHVGGKARRRGMDHAKIAVPGIGQHDVHADLGGRGIDQAAPGYERRRLGEPGREPEALDLALGLVARAGAAVEAVE